MRKYKLTTLELDELSAKKTFVLALSEALHRQYKSIDSIDYDVFIDKDGNLNEFLVMTYRGGAIAVRNCYGDSKNAILHEIANLSDGGYYDEVKDYRELKATKKQQIL